MGVKFSSPPLCRNNLPSSAYNKSCHQKTYLHLTYAVTVVNWDPIILRVVYNCRIQKVVDFLFSLALWLPHRIERRLQFLLPASCCTKAPISFPYRPPHKRSRLSSLPPSASFSVKSPVSPSFHIPNQVPVPLPCLLPHSRASKLSSFFRTGACIKHLKHNSCHLPHWIPKKNPINLPAL